MEAKTYSIAFLFVYAFSQLTVLVVCFAAYTDEEDQKYAESRMLSSGPYPQLRKVIQEKTIASLLNNTEVCDLKPGDFIKLCQEVCTYKKNRFAYEPYGLNVSIVPEKCQYEPLKFHWDNTSLNSREFDTEGSNFQIKFQWKNKTAKNDPLVEARKCPTTTESPLLWISQGKERGAIFMYTRSCPGKTHIRLEDYLFFAKNYYYQQ